MNIFKKIYDFLIDYEEVLKFIFVIFAILFSLITFIRYYDEQLTIDKNIIKNTKDYVIYDNCHKFDTNFYCWNDGE